MLKFSEVANTEQQAAIRIQQRIQHYERYYPFFLLGTKGGDEDLADQVTDDMQSAVVDLDDDRHGGSKAIRCNEGFQGLVFPIDRCTDPNMVELLERFAARGRNLGRLTSGKPEYDAYSREVQSRWEALEASAPSCLSRDAEWGFTPQDIAAVLPWLNSHIPFVTKIEQLQLHCPSEQSRSPSRRL